MRASLGAAVAMVILVLSGCAGPEVRILAVADRILNSERTSRDQVQLKESAALLREADFSPRRLAGYSDETVARLFRSVRRTTFQLPEEIRFIDWQRRLLREKVRRGRLIEGDAVDMFKAYLGARLFDSARAVSQEFPGAKYPPLPAVVASPGIGDEGRWVVYDVLEGGEKVRLEALPLGAGAKIVVVILTGCGVSELAMTEILANPEFAGRFRGHGALLTEQFDSVGVEMWKNHFKFGSVFIARKGSDFPGFNFRSSPQFYFLKDGRIVDYFDGWGASGGLGAISRLGEGMKAIGI